MATTILIVDDDPVQRRLLEAAISRSGMNVVTAPGGRPALDLIEGPRGEQISLMLLDLVMPDMDGLEVLAKLRGSNPTLPVIVLTAKGGIDSAVEAMRAGANDFLVKPASPERITVSIRNQLKIGTLSGEVTRLKKKSENRLVFDDLVAKSGEMKQVFRLGQRAAQSNIPILIEGESGVGKELIARAIQGSSERAGKPFVTVNCGAIPENLIESILFGHEKGSFTGASDKHLGKFQEADGGTLFLDEIGELRLDMQVKLLRALQEGEVDPVGAKRPVKVDVRIISATNRDLVGADARRPLPRRPLLPPQRVPDLRARFARPCRGHSGFGTPFRQPLCGRRTQAGGGHDARSSRSARGLCLAGQCAPARKYDIPRRGAVRRLDARCLRFSADRRCDGRRSEDAPRLMRAPNLRPCDISRPRLPALALCAVRHGRFGPYAQLEIWNPNYPSRHFALRRPYVRSSRAGSASAVRRSIASSRNLAWSRRKAKCRWRKLARKKLHFKLRVDASSSLYSQALRETFTRKSKHLLCHNGTGEVHP